MKLGLYQYGHANELPGLAVGVTRTAPRGIRREDRSRRGYFDVWMPLLAPSKDLVKAYRSGTIEFSEFAKRYRREMNDPASKQAIQLVAAMAQRSPINLGCFCEDENRCHRSVLAKLVHNAAKSLPPTEG